LLRDGSTRPRAGPTRCDSRPPALAHLLPSRRPSFSSGHRRSRASDPAQVRQPVCSRPQICYKLDPSAPEADPDPVPDPTLLPTNPDTIAVASSPSASLCPTWPHPSLPSRPLSPPPVSAMSPLRPCRSRNRLPWQPRPPPPQELPPLRLTSPLLSALQARVATVEVEA
jgi:hypothetical protein